MIEPNVTQPVELDAEARPQRAAFGSRLAGKRVAMVTFSPYPFDPRPRRAIDALVGEGASIELICLAEDDAPGRLTVNEIDVRRVPIKHQRHGKFQYAYEYSAFIFLSSAILALRSLARRYDLVYVHNMPDILVVSALIPKVFGAKVVLDLHDPMPELMMTIFETSRNSKSVRLMERIEKWSLARADLVVTVSTTFAKIFASRSCGAEKIAVVMNSPDSKIFPYHEPRLNAETSQSGDNSFVIMYHGSLIERNGLDIAIEAFAEVRGKMPGAELRIFGSKTPFLERMMEVVKRQKLENVVHYLGPRMLEDLVPEIEKCDLGVVPNHRNAFTDINTPTRIFEYLALGKPVIAPATSGVTDYFDKNSLLFFESGNASNLARQFEYAYSHPAETLEIARRGQKIFHDHDWAHEKETLVSRVAALLDNA